MKTLWQRLFLAAIVLTTVSFPFAARSDYNYSSRQFGSDGRDGRRGSTGSPGSDGPDREAAISGSWQQFDLSGGDGGDGGRGGYGHDAYGCSQPHRPSHNLRGADGGDGGRGGSGGRGGHGGNLTLFYQQRSHLRQVRVVAVGGPGGRGGQGGWGGDGCDCDDRSWERDDRRYYCYNGRDGRRGTPGTFGADGNLGTLSLVGGLTALEPELPEVTLPLSELTAAPVYLSRNIWETRSGARDLLAPNSFVADEYREFVDRLEGSFEVVWNVDRDAADLDNFPLTLALDETGDIGLESPEDLWLDSEISQQGDRVILSVLHAIPAREVTQLRLADVSRNFDGFQIALVDLAQQSDILATEFAIEYRSGDDRRRSLRTRYEGEIPGNLVDRHYNRFVIDVESLPIDGEFLEAGTNVEIEITVKRSLGNRTAEQQLLWQGEIRDR